MSSQLCLRCGRHEYAGSFCSYCRTAEYDLVDHEHGKDTGSTCPLGPYLDPLTTSSADIRRSMAKPPTARLVGIPVRHHPRTPGYTVDTDPPAPAWIARPGSRGGRSAHSEVKAAIRATPAEQLALSPSFALTPEDPPLASTEPNGFAPVAFGPIPSQLA